MSSFIVNDKTINRILTFFSSWNFSGNIKLKDEFWGLVYLGIDETTEQVLSSIGLLLKELNAKAVSQRYNEKLKVSGFSYSEENCNIFQAYNHLRCLTYQMMEGNVPETDLYKLLERIENQFEEQIASEHPKVKDAEWEAK